MFYCEYVFGGRVTLSNDWVGQASLSLRLMKQALFLQQEQVEFQEKQAIATADSRHTSKIFELKKD